MSFGLCTALGRAVVKWLRGTTLAGLVAAGGLAGCDGQPSTSATGSVGFPWQAVDAELEHACALAQGVTYCWGDIPTLPGQSNTPIEFKGVEHFVDVGVGVNFSCGLTGNGQVYCWGSNNVGQLGRLQGAGTTQLDWEPDPIDSNRTFDQISVGYSHVCGISEGEAYCWGRNNHGQLGNGQSGTGIWWTPNPIPQPVLGGLRFLSISAGRNHTCGITPTNEAYCWGKNDYGQLGIHPGEVTTPGEPVKVDGGHSFKIIDADGDNTCAISLNNTAYCWGHNLYGQLGNGQFAAEGSGVTYLIEHEPVEVGPGHKATDIEVGLFFACAAHVQRIPLPSGSAAPKPLVTCWGRNDKGQLGQTSSKEDCRSGNPCTPLPDSLRIMAQPRPMTSDQRPAGQRVFHPKLSVGRNMACALVQTSTGILFDPNARLYCWGFGPLGDGSGQDSATPVFVATP